MDRVRCRALVAFPRWPALRSVREVALALALVLSACTVPVAGALDEEEANRVVIALDQASIDVSKEADPAAEGKYRVMVGPDDVPRALAAMHNEGAPRSRPSGLLDTVGSVGRGALVPSEAAEQAGIVAGMAGDLQRSIEGIDGVLSARVHLSLPPLMMALTMGRDAVARASASVLVEFRGASPPLAADSIQRLVAGAVAGLAPSDVVVVMLPRPSPVVGGSAGGIGSLAHIGPVAVARGSVRLAQGIAAALLACLVGLSIALLIMWNRLVRVETKLREAGVVPDGDG